MAVNIKQLEKKIKDSEGLSPQQDVTPEHIQSFAAKFDVDVKIWEMNDQPNVYCFEIETITGNRVFKLAKGNKIVDDLGNVVELATIIDLIGV